MSDPISPANQPLTAAELAAFAALTAEDLQVIDNAILAHCSRRWCQIAEVVRRAADALRPRHPELSPASCAERLIWLVEEGILDSQGNLDDLRFSEVRRPLPPAKG